jgi:hypothetical protein
MLFWALLASGQITMNNRSTQGAMSVMNSTAMDGDHVEVLRDVADMEMLRDFWLACNPLRDANPDLFRFLIDTRRQGDTPHILTLRAGGELKALLVGRLIRTRLPIKIGYFRVPSPELRMLIISGWLGEIDETRAALFVDFLRRLLAKGEANAALLSYPELTSPLARQALAQPTFACRDHFIIREHHPILDLPIGDKSFLASLSQNQRYQQRKRDRELAKDANCRNDHTKDLTARYRGRLRREQ